MPTDGLLDVDGDGVVDAEHDGAIVLFWMFGLRGAGLTAQVSSEGCTRCDGEVIEAYLQFIEAYLDADDSGGLSALTDGALIYRFLSGASPITPDAQENALVDAVDCHRCDPALIAAYLEEID